MKLYLSSYRIPTPKALRTLLGKPFNQVKVVIIPNAKDYKPADERTAKIREVKNDLRHFGFALSVIDLRDYENAEKLAADLQQNQLVWVAGGNVFALRKAMKQSGFDRIITPLVKNEDIVYAGESAGAMVAGTSLRGAEFADETAGMDEIIWEGLGLIQNIFAPHADNPAFADSIRHMNKLYSADKQYIRLNDNQAFVVNEDKTELTTASKA